MRAALIVLLVLLLLRAPVAMAAAGDSFRLFAQSVLPGLFPYMTVSLMLLSRLPRDVPPLALMVMGWCGGSPTGSRLIREAAWLRDGDRRRLAVTCATMSPMFLVGTLRDWTGDIRLCAGVLCAVLLGGYGTGLCVRGSRRAQPCANAPAPPARPLSLGEAVEQTARTMLLVCGTMAMLRIAAVLSSRLLARWSICQLVVTTLLEVTCGARQLAALPLPRVWRGALLSLATGFGGVSILLQNRAVLPEGLLRLREQLMYQLLHGAVSMLVFLALAALGV